jgi:hypothetical protein
LAPESQFDLAYNAAHSLSLAALRWHGYRSTKRYVVFQSLEHTLGLPSAIWRVLDKAHQLRNLAEYEGEVEIERRMVLDLLNVPGLSPMPFQNWASEISDFLTADRLRHISARPRQCGSSRWLWRERILELTPDFAVQGRRRERRLP